jgi:hypothetical protein
MTDEGGRLTFSRVLMLDGYRVQVAATAEEGLGQIERARPDAILLDLKMPLINGRTSSPARSPSRKHPRASLVEASWWFLPVLPIRPDVVVRSTVHVVTEPPPLPPCPRCHRLTGVEEEEQSGSSLRWFCCRLCAHVWSSSPRPPH